MCHVWKLLSLGEGCPQIFHNFYMTFMEPCNYTDYSDDVNMRVMPVFTNSAQMRAEVSWESQYGCPNQAEYKYNKQLSLNCYVTCKLYPNLPFLNYLAMGISSEILKPVLDWLCVPVRKGLVSSVTDNLSKSRSLPLPWCKSQTFTSQLAKF